MPAQKPGAVLAHGHSWFCCSVFLASLQLHSVTMESKAWPSGSVALGTKLRFNTTACPRCLHSPLWLGQHFALLPPSALETGLLYCQSQSSKRPLCSLLLGLECGVGWEAWKRLGDGGKVTGALLGTSLRTGSIPSCPGSPNLPSLPAPDDFKLLLIPFRPVATACWLASEQPV